MTAIHVKAFRGMVPRISPRLLQPNQATAATNLRITSGRIDPLPGLSLDKSVGYQANSIWRYRHFIAGSPVDNWMAWSKDVDAVKSPIADDGLGRVYFSSDEFEPRMTTYADAVTASPVIPAAWFGLGVFAPTQAMTVTPPAGSTETRAYVSTFVTKYGEESGPSPATVATGAAGTWSLSNLQAPPSNTGTITAVQNNLPLAGRVTLTLNTTYGLDAGDTLTVSGVTGMTDLNGTLRIFSVDQSTSKIVVLLSTTQTYVSGGAWSKNGPHNLSSMKRRIYRSAGTNAQYLFVAEISASLTTYSDTVATSALGEVLPTSTGLPAPKNLRCLKSLPNGCLVGILDNQVCFSEPYLPYSWPIANRYSFSQRAVNVVPAGNSVIVLTDGHPILFVGDDPAAMTPSVMATYAPCVSKRSAVDVGGGVIYASNDGLWLATLNQVQRITEKLYREKEWVDLNPSSMHSAVHDGQYYACYFKNGAIASRVLIVDLAEPDSVVELNESPLEMFRNDYDGGLYFSVGENIYRYGTNQGKLYSSEWTSMENQLPRPLNFSVAQIHADFAEQVAPDTDQIARNAALIASGADAVSGWLGGYQFADFEIGGSAIVPVVQPQDKRIQFILYSNNVPVFTRFVTSSTPFRLPAGFRTESIKVGVNTAVPTYSITIADSVAELARASA